MSGTISGTYGAALTLTSARFADPVTNLGTISLSNAGTALYAATGWTVVNEALIAAAPGAGSYGILLAAGGAVSNAAGATVAGGAAIDMRGDAGSVLNAGLLQGVNNAGVDLQLGGAVTNLASAAISGDRAVFVQGASGTVLNAGTLAGSRYAGVELDAGGYVSNAATAEITGGTRAVSIAGAPGQVYNAGLITDTTRGAVVLTDGGGVINAATGTIESNGTYGGPAGAGIKLYGGVGTVTNAGSIFSGNAAGVAIYAGGTVSNATHGRIAGYLGVYAVTVAPVIVNAGSIAGTRSNGIFLVSGGAVTNLATASITGVDAGIYGLLGAPAPTVVNDGVVASTSKSGIALFGGGTVVNQASGTITGYLSGIHFEYGGGTLVNAGTVGPAHGANAAVTFAAGYANRLVVDPGAVFLGRVLGGNTLGAAATSTLELAAGAGTLAGIGTSLVDFSAITFDPGAAWLLAGSAGALAGGETISGFMPRDTIELVGTAETFVALSGGRLTLSGGSTLDMPGFAATPYVTNDGTNTTITPIVATITGTHVAGISLTSPAYADPVTVGYGATIAPTAASGGYGLYAASVWTAVNQGMIESLGNNGNGILFTAGGLVSNAAGATISGAALGVLIHYNGTVSNAAGGTIAGTRGGVEDSFAPGRVVNGGLISGGTSKYAYGVKVDGGLVSNAAGGTITAAGVASYGVRLFASGTVINAGTIGGGAFAVSAFRSAYYSDRLVVDPGAVFIGKVDFANPGSGQSSSLELASGFGVGTLSGLGSSFVGFGTIGFDPAARWLVAGSSTAFAYAAISGFASTDTIELTGTVESYGALAGGMLTLSGGTTLDMPGLTGAKITNDGSNTFITACFAAGTAIATEFGPRAVEALAVGDRVLTASGRLAPIRWIGHRRVDLRRHPRPHDVLPVRVRAGAFGGGLPVRDLVLSPDHAVFVDLHLVPIRHLINGASIVQETRVSVTYWHVELDRHDVILAEGLACESYLDTGNRCAFEGEDAVMLHADFARAVWAAEGCAPILTDPADARMRTLHLRLLIGAHAARGPGVSSATA